MLERGRVDNVVRSFVVGLQRKWNNDDDTAQCFIVLTDILAHFTEG